jgi:type IV secretion system protein TrbL
MIGPVPVPGLGWVAGKILNATSDVGLTAIAKGVSEAVTTMLETVATLWFRLDVPNVWTGSTAPVVAALQSQVSYLAGTLAVLGLIIAGGRLALDQRGDPVHDVFHGLLVLVLVTGAGVPVIGLLTSASDAWARSILANGTGNADFGRNLLQLVSPTGVLGPVLIVMFGIVALLLSVAQVVALAFRAVVLILLAGLLPVSASMTTTPGGQRQFRTVVAWVIALVAYKPLAALIYVTAFRMIATPTLDDAKGVGLLLLGLTMMAVAVCALPALLRLVVPAAHATQPSPIHVNPTAALPRGARIVSTRGH